MIVRRSHARITIVTAAVIAAVISSTPRLGGQKLDPLVYTISFPQPASKTFTVNVSVPTGKRDSVEMMMAIWSPGFYGIQNYADRVTTFSATAPDGVALDVQKPNPSRWTIKTGGRPTIDVSYTLSAPRGGNLSNGVTETGAVIIGPSTYVTLVETAHRPAEVRLELPAGWTRSMTSLDASSDGKPNHYVAPDYDILADSPILAGVDLSSTEFTVGGIKHYWTYLGKAEWEGAKVAAAITPLIEEHIRFWGGLPYRKYAFLNIVTAGGGSGVEHLNSVAITGSGKEPVDQTARFRNAAFISHEYFHAMNVKRLRPIELGPFDYEHAPVTTGLWVGEGLTSYFGDLLAARSGMGDANDYLFICSRHISDLQLRQPGRLFQTIEQASSQMFDRTIPNDKKVDYYVKGPVVGLVLDAHIRKLTNNAKSMDDVIRLEYKRYSGEHGYTGPQFNQTVSDAAGVDVSALLHKLIATTEEVDYTEMLDWFGLRFMTGDPAKAWTLEVRPDATAAQKAHFASFLEHSKAR
jgi:predicted metalloprotease with PDZ domain